MSPEPPRSRRLVMIVAVLFALPYLVSCSLGRTGGTTLSDATEESKKVPKARDPSRTIEAGEKIDDEEDEEWPGDLYPDDEAVGKSAVTDTTGGALLAAGPEVDSTEPAGSAAASNPVDLARSFIGLSVGFMAYDKDEIDQQRLLGIQIGGILFRSRGRIRLELDLIGGDVQLASELREDFTDPWQLGAGVTARYSFTSAHTFTGVHALAGSDSVSWAGTTGPPSTSRVKMGWFERSIAIA